MRIRGRPNPARRRAVPTREAVIDRLADRKQEQRSDQPDNREREDEADPATARGQRVAGSGSSCPAPARRSRPLHSERVRVYASLLEENALAERALLPPSYETFRAI